METLEQIDEEIRRTEIALDELKIRRAEKRYAAALAELTAWWDATHPGEPMVPKHLFDMYRSEMVTWIIANPNTELKPHDRDSMLSEGSMLIIRLKRAGDEVWSTRANHRENQRYFDEMFTAHPGKWIPRHGGTYVRGLIFDTEAECGTYVRALPHDLFINNSVVELKHREFMRLG